MSIELILAAALQDPSAAAKAAHAEAQQSNNIIQRRVAELASLVYRLKAAADDEQLIDELEEEAAELAEELEIEFIYDQASGVRRTYSPESCWEQSGGCEWEESSEEGITHGWNI